MSLQTPPAAPAHPVNSAAKAPARQQGNNQHGNANGGVSPFAQLLQGISDDAMPDAPSQVDKQPEDDEPAERSSERHEKRKAKDSADDATPTPPQQQAQADAPPADQSTASMSRASLLAAARARAGAEARGRAAALPEAGDADRAAGPGHLTGKDLLQAASDAANAGLDISAFKPALDAAAVNLAPAEPAAAGQGDFSLPSLGAAGTAPAGPAPEAMPAQATLTPPPGSAGFPSALGAQLNTWLKDGVQYASLELNPQDMGPIDVRIALRDGRTQVELGADVAATRQALADALPALAEALGDVGLSLSGGSVSDQTGQHGRQGDGEAQRGFSLPGWLAPAREGETGQTAVPLRAQRGLIDLVA